MPPTAQTEPHMAGICYQHYCFDFHTIEKIRVSDFQTLPNYLQVAVRFCQQWLTSTQGFSFRTSGSTGTPKSITLTKQLMEWSACHTLRYFGLQAGDRMLVNLDIRFVGGAMMLVRAMIGGLWAHLIEPCRLPLLQTNETFDFYSFVPLQLQATWQQAPEQLRSLTKAKGILIGGAPLTPQLEQVLAQYPAPFVHTYGMTETASHIALRPIGESFYQAFQDVRLWQDNRGCLVLQTPHHKQAIVTNDLIELVGSHHFRWLGRSDNTINSGGVKIQLEQIESITAQGLHHMGIDTLFFATALPDTLLGQKLVLVFAKNSLSPTQESELLSYLRQHLPRYWVPQQIIYQRTIHQSESGKILRQLTSD